MNIIDTFNKTIGNTVAWLVIIMVFGTLYNVVARYFFGDYSIQLGEIVIMMNAAMFLLAAPLLLYLDQHVRVDVFYSRLSTRGQALVDFLGTLFLLLPLCGFILVYSWNYVASSWAQNESSAQTGGLPGLFLFKTLIVVFAILMALQGISMLFHKFNIIRNPRLTTVKNHNESV